jgi:hypothetical protein
VSRHTWATATLRAECFEMLSWVLGLFMWLKDFRLASKCHVAPCCPDNSWGCDTIPCCMPAVMGGEGALVSLQDTQIHCGLDN